MPVSTRVPQNYRGVPSDVWKEVVAKFADEGETQQEQPQVAQQQVAPQQPQATQELASRSNLYSQPQPQTIQEYQRQEIHQAMEPILKAQMEQQEVTRQRINQQQQAAQEQQQKVQQQQVSQQFNQQREAFQQSAPQQPVPQQAIPNKLPEPIPLVPDTPKNDYVTAETLQKQNEALTNAILNGLQRNQPQSVKNEPSTDNVLDDLSKFNLESFTSDEVKELVPLIKTIAKNAASSTPVEKVDENKIIDKILGEINSKQQRQKMLSMDEYLDKTQSWAIPYKRSRQFADFMGRQIVTPDGIDTGVTYSSALNSAYVRGDREAATTILNVFKKNLEMEANGSKLNTASVVEPSVNTAPVMVATTPAKEEQPVTEDSIIQALKELDEARRGRVDRNHLAKARASLEAKFGS